jgi:hypothetical protein
LAPQPLVAAHMPARQTQVESSRQTLWIEVNWQESDDDAPNVAQ